MVFEMASKESGKNKADGLWPEKFGEVPPKGAWHRLLCSLGNESFEVCRLHGQILLKTHTDFLFERKMGVLCRSIAFCSQNPLRTSPRTWPWWSWYSSWGGRPGSSRPPRRSSSGWRERRGWFLGGLGGSAAGFGGGEKGWLARFVFFLMFFGVWGLCLPGQVTFVFLKVP